MSKNSLEQNKRVFTALIFFGAVLILYQSFFYTPPPDEALSPEEAAAVEERQQGADPAEPAEAAADEEEAEPAVAHPEPEELPLFEVLVGDVEGDHIVWKISNVGASLRDVEIVEPARFQPREDMRGVFPDESRELAVFAAAVEELGLNPDSIYEVDEAASQRSGDYWTKLVLRWTSPDGRSVITRTYEQDGRPFAMRSTISLSNRSQAPYTISRARVEVMGVFTEASRGLFNPAVSVLEAICHQGRRTDRTHAKKVDEPTTPKENVWFAGVTERYFLTAAALRGPEGEAAPGGLCRFRPDPRGDVVVIDFILPEQVVAPSSEVQLADLTLYTGPKDRTYLERFPHAFGSSVDLGWLSFLASPIRWMLVFLQGFVFNWGLAIVVLTLLIKLLTWPLTTKSFRSMEKMREISPLMTELRAKYENDQTKLAEAQMKLFREKGVSPLGGCLPMLLQMPIYLALYQTIWGSAELYQAHLAGWIEDLSSPDPIFVLPLLMGVIMFVQQKIMPAAGDNPQMKIVQKIMPIMFTAFMLFLPSGLVLYILVNMMLSISQQIWIRRSLAREKAAAGETTTSNPPPLEKSGGGGSSKKSKKRR